MNGSSPLDANLNFNYADFITQAQRIQRRLTRVSLKPAFAGRLDEGRPLLNLIAAMGGYSFDWATAVAELGADIIVRELDQLEMLVEQALAQLNSGGNVNETLRAGNESFAHLTKFYAEGAIPTDEWTGTVNLEWDEPARTTRLGISLMHVVFGSVFLGILLLVLTQNPHPIIATFAVVPIMMIVASMVGIKRALSGDVGCDHDVSPRALRIGARSWGMILDPERLVLTRRDGDQTFELMRADAGALVMHRDGTKSQEPVRSQQNQTRVSVGGISFTGSGDVVRHWFTAHLDLRDSGVEVPPLNALAHPSFSDGRSELLWVTLGKWWPYPERRWTETPDAVFQMGEYRQLPWGVR